MSERLSTGLRPLAGDLNRRSLAETLLCGYTRPMMMRRLRIRQTPCPAMEPIQPPTSSDPLHGQVAAVIERIRPAVQMDGGDVELVEVTADRVARIRLHGACVGCPSSSITLHMGIKRHLIEQVPGVAGVEQVP